MEACGLIVEYNPFHNGHLYHVKKARQITKADVIIAIMSGSFLQRGEPAIIDKYYRAQMALQAGVDLVIELPYAFAVQNSELFARGAVQLLHALNGKHLCFGSESGRVAPFEKHYKQMKQNKTQYQHTLKNMLSRGQSFPSASKHAVEMIFPELPLDITKPNNILGFSYIKEILDSNLPIQPHTIKRIKNNYHDVQITNSIASATSIRTKLIKQNEKHDAILSTIPHSSYKQLTYYKEKTGIWHHWENYFPYLHYKVTTMSTNDLAQIEGVDEGLEYRIKKTAPFAVSFDDWMKQLKTKRYTWTRLQRMFVHILTHTTKQEMNPLKELKKMPYIRILGMNAIGQTYLNSQRNACIAPFISRYSGKMHPLLTVEERASRIYYSPLPRKVQKQMIYQEFRGPIIDKN
ncbi:MAG TPA: nucleotidyltransferase [Cerasibacillus sp.]|uniref:nucleotidyltransferase n=1 Tax=Cerasibacillus sp. TaxID=2498711 RepID=UPI002F429B59